MLSRIHNKLGTAGLVVAVIALVAALAGTAFAAAGLNGKQKKEVKKIAKQFAGKNGAPGATGPQGPAGPAGAKGDTGAVGPEGPKGPEGPEGPEGAEGIPGEEGPEGSPWTAGGVLPSGKTETGTWGFYPAGGRVYKFALSEETCEEEAEPFPCYEYQYSETEVAVVSLPFNIPLSAAPEALVYNEPETTNCPGTAANPKAAAGKVCVYVEGAAYPTDPQGVKHVAPFDKKYTAGAVLALQGQQRAKYVYGTWAVTAK